MASFIRGSTVSISAVFKDSTDVPVDPVTAHVYLTYRRLGQIQRQVPFEMVSGTGHMWSYDWDSSVADPGEVSGHVRTTGDAPISSEDFKFSLTANAANPNG